MMKLFKKNLPPPVDPKYYTRDYFLNWGNYSDFLKSKGTSFEGFPIYKRIIELAQIKPKMRVLDLGCGRGELLVHFARLGAFVEGIDYSKAAIKFAKRSISTQPKKIRDKIKIKQADVKNIIFPQNHYDRILMIDLIEHLNPWEIDIILPRVRAALKQSGLLIIHTHPNRLVADYGFFLYKIWHYLVYRKPPKEIIRNQIYDPVMHINEQTLHSLKKILRKSQFFYYLWAEEGWFFEMLKCGVKKSWFRKIIVNILKFWPFKLFFFIDIYAIAKKNNEKNFDFKLVGY